MNKITYPPEPLPPKNISVHEYSVDCPPPLPDPEPDCPGKDIKTIDPVLGMSLLVAFGLGVILYLAITNQ